MSGWTWLTRPERPYTRGFIARVVVKAALLFVVANLVFALLNPLPWLGRLSLYNVVLPGRARLPYGEDWAASYNLSLYNIPAMLASHELARPKPADEYRVVLLGDSSTWGFLLEPDQTLSAYLNDSVEPLSGDRAVRFYNLGYPVMSLTKDVLLLDEAMQYQPDMIVWLLTLESLPPEQQLFPPLVQNNAERIRSLNERYSLGLDPADPRLVDPAFLDRTIVGQRRALADLLRLQLLGFLWAATGIDQDIPDTYTPRQEDFAPDPSWHGYESPVELEADDLAFTVLQGGIDRAGDVPVLLVNEPMFISAGESSDIRYNFFYPRWVYDQYRDLLADFAARQGLPLADYWNLVPPTEFTDSAVHMTPAGTEQLAAELRPVLGELIEGDLSG